MSRNPDTEFANDRVTAEILDGIRCALERIARVMEQTTEPFLNEDGTEMGKRFLDIGRHLS